VTGGLLFLLVFLVIDRPGADTLPFLAVSSVVHVVYVVALTLAYGIAIVLATISVLVLLAMTLLRPKETA